MDRDPLTERIIGCAIEVHRTLGPGLLESAYERCLAYELGQHGVQFRQQVTVTPLMRHRIDRGTTTCSSTRVISSLGVDQAPYSYELWLASVPAC